MAKISPPKAWFYLKKQKRLRTGPDGPAPAGSTYVTGADGQNLTGADGATLLVSSP